ncbi:MAG: DUF1697 domain-containing protein [Chromatiales bacterium]|nr:MAG: DUF1697 domain-containing protein [Chromatiales bacterium]
MNRYVLLLRGINVGGHNKLPMKDLREILEALGCESVKTYIQSGNVVLSAKTAPDESAISADIEKQFGFSPRVLAIPGEHFEAVADANPYKDEDLDGKFLHVLYLAGPASADMDGLNSRKGPGEEFTLTDDAFYLKAPDGIGRSKLANDVEKLLGVEGTGRNLNTVRKLVAMLA